MNDHLKSTTDHLIKDYKYDELWDRLQMDPEKFLSNVKQDLINNFLRTKKPRELGNLFAMCGKDVSAKEIELCNQIDFNEHWWSMLREFVAVGLAYVIRDRLDPKAKTHIQAYHGVLRQNASAK